MTMATSEEIAALERRIEETRLDIQLGTKLDRMATILQGRQPGGATAPAVSDVWMARLARVRNRIYPGQVLRIPR